MHEDGFPFQHSSISNLCTLYSGPIEASDTHEFCVLYLGLAHAEAALNGSSCLHCEEFSVRVLRAPRNVALCDFSRQCPFATNEPLVGRKPHMGDQAERRDSPPSLQCASLKRVFGPPLALRRLSRSVRRGTMTILTKQCPWRHPRRTGPIFQKTALKWRDTPHSRMSWSGFSPRLWAISAEPQENVILFLIIYVCMLLVKKNSSEYTETFEWKKDYLWVQTV